MEKYSKIIKSYNGRNARRESGKRYQRYFLRLLPFHYFFFQILPQKFIPVKIKKKSSEISGDQVLP